MNEATAQRVALALVSHTNVGKTTLARTLIGLDVGTVKTRRTSRRKRSASR
jgi:peptide subunit release factor RF-3